MNPVDLYVLKWNSNDRPEWLKQCLDSLAGEPVNLGVFDGALEIGKARAAAIREGAAPYVSFVDDDDWVEPGAIQKCVGFLEYNKSFVGTYTDLNYRKMNGDLIRSSTKGIWCPRKQMMDMGGGSVGHLSVFRRDAVTSFLPGLEKIGRIEDLWLYAMLAKKGPWKKLDIVGYNKRVGYESASRNVPGSIRKTVITDKIEALTGVACPNHLHDPPLPAATLLDRVNDWANRDTGCATCNKIRRATGRGVNRIAAKAAAPGSRRQDVRR
jgi:hypothetical protein